jgi:Ca2+-transporting ATPase
LQWVFRSVPLETGEWLQVVAVAMTVVLVVELDKWLRKRRDVHTAL